MKQTWTVKCPIGAAVHAGQHKRMWLLLFMMNLNGLVRFEMDMYHNTESVSF